MYVFEFTSYSEDEIIKRIFHIHKILLHIDLYIYFFFFGICTLIYFYFLSSLLRFKTVVLHRVNKTIIFSVNKTILSNY